MDLNGKTIAVTGATGFLGRYIVDVLQKRGARVIGVVRNPQRVPELAARGVELRQADLAQPERLQAGFAGADVVVSNAALFAVTKMIGGRRTREEHRQANITGTQNVFGAVAAAGVPRVVQVSSVAVYGSLSLKTLNEEYPQLNERTWQHPGNAYQVSKALSEQLAWRLAEQHELALTTVRPCAIYGAFDQNFMRIFKLLVGLPVSIFPTLARLPLVYGGDVAEAIALALERPVSVGKAYNITGDEDATLKDFLDAWRAAGGKVPRVMLPLPIPVKQSFDHRRAREDLGWRNRSYVEALRETRAIEGAAS